MKLSKRLLTIADLCKGYDIIYDVGSDHALLPIYLIKHEFCLKAYAGDNKKGPLFKALNNIKENNLEKQIKVDLYDGINPEINADLIVIAGMGVHNIIEIIKKVKLSKYQSFIISTNKNMHILRSYLNNLNVMIDYEKVLKDEDHYYEIMKISYSKQKLKLDPYEIKYGAYNLKTKDDDFKDYLKFKLSKYEFLYKEKKLLNYLKEANEIKDLLQNF